MKQRLHPLLIIFAVSLVMPAGGMILDTPLKL